MLHSTFNEKIIGMAQGIFTQHGTSWAAVKMMYRYQQDENVKAAFLEIKGTFSYVSNRHLEKVLKLPRGSFDHMHRKPKAQDERVTARPAVRDRTRVNF